MTQIDDYLSLLAHIEASIMTREFRDLEPLLLVLEQSAAEPHNSSILAASASRIRACFSHLHNDMLHKADMDASRLIGAFRKAPFYRSPLPLMSGLALLTVVAASITSRMGRAIFRRVDVPEDVLATCDRSIDEYHSSESECDAYSSAAEGIVDYIRGRHEDAFKNFGLAEAYFERHPELAPQDHLMWTYRGVCNTLSEQAIMRHLSSPTQALQPSGCLLAANPGKYVSFAASDSVYFEAFAANLCRSFFETNMSGALHIHAVVSDGESLRKMSLWHKALPTPIAARLGVSWGVLPEPLLVQGAGDARDAAISYFTLIRYLLSPWIMASYGRPLFIHDIDLTFVAGWDETFDWCAAQRVAVAHNTTHGLANCMPWFDKQAICTFIANSRAGGFYAQGLAKVGWAHFRTNRTNK